MKTITAAVVWLLMLAGVWVVPTDTRAGVLVQRHAVVYRLESLGFSRAEAEETVRTLDAPRLARLASRLGNPMAGMSLLIALSVLLFISFAAFFLLVAL